LNGRPIAVLQHADWVPSRDIGGRRGEGSGLLRDRLTAMAGPVGSRTREVNWWAGRSEAADSVEACAVRVIS